MTPNKLPPLPEPCVLRDHNGEEVECYTAHQMNRRALDVIAALTEPCILPEPQKWLNVWPANKSMWETHRARGVYFDERQVRELLAYYAAEALRQSQSLPSGAVAGLVHSWRQSAHDYRYVAEPSQTDRAEELEAAADELEQALQADAREKGEAGDEAMALHWIDRYAAGIDDEPQMDRIREALATHPAQASEAVDWRDLYRFQTAMRYMDNNRDLTRDRAYQMADDDIDDIEKIATSSQETASE